MAMIGMDSEFVSDLSKHDGPDAGQCRSTGLFRSWVIQDLQSNSGRINPSPVMAADLSPGKTGMAHSTDSWTGRYASIHWDIHRIPASIYLETRDMYYIFLHHIDVFSALGLR
jgi:hypothetical protein